MSTQAVLPNSLVVVAARIRNHLIKQVLDEKSEVRYDDSENEETLALLAYINNFSDEDLLMSALDKCVDLNELSDNLASVMYNEWRSLQDLPF